MSEQIEKAFQKQAGVSLNTNAKKRNTRWYKDCPFTGDVSIRGRILTGVVVSTKMKRTVVIRREYLHYIPKYSRYEKRHRNISAHMSPAFVGVEAGDILTVGQCRPLSKTVRFNVLKVTKGKKASKAFQKF
ncbi:unnamed protein product [Umbelopsis ramanniana]